MDHDIDTAIEMAQQDTDGRLQFGGLVSGLPRLLGPFRFQGVQDLFFQEYTLNHEHRVPDDALG